MLSGSFFETLFLKATWSISLRFSFKSFHSVLKWKSTMALVKNEMAIYRIKKVKVILKI